MSQTENKYGLLGMQVLYKMGLVTRKKFTNEQRKPCVEFIFSHGTSLSDAEIETLEHIFDAKKTRGYANHLGESDTQISGPTLFMTGLVFEDCIVSN